MRFGRFGKAAIAVALVTTALGGPALAQDWGGGRDRGDRGGDRGDWGGRYDDRDYGQGGRFWYGGDYRQRLERLSDVAQRMAETGRINRWEARNVNELIRETRRLHARYRADGSLSGRERAFLDQRIERIRATLRQSRRDRDDPVDYRRR